jgi:hypothetical protein
VARPENIGLPIRPVPDPTGKAGFGANLSNRHSQVIGSSAPIAVADYRR